MIETVTAAYTSLAIDTGTLGDQSVVIRDGARASYKALILLLHGDHLSCSMYSPAFQAAGWYDHARALAARGYLVCAIDAGGVSAWANPAVTQPGGIIDLARLSTFARYPIFSAKVGLFGFSMGGLTALLYAKFNPTVVGAIELVSPATDTRWCYNLAGYTAPYSNGSAVVSGLFQTEINAAFACTTATFLTKTAGYRPEDDYSPWRGLCPIKVIGADDDPALPGPSYPYFVAQVADPQVTLHRLATGGHGPILAIDPYETSQFFEGCLWPAAALFPYTEKWAGGGFLAYRWTAAGVAHVAQTPVAATGVIQNGAVPAVNDGASLLTDVAALKQRIEFDVSSAGTITGGASYLTAYARVTTIGFNAIMLQASVGGAGSQWNGALYVYLNSGAPVSLVSHLNLGTAAPTHVKLTVDVAGNIVGTLTFPTGPVTFTATLSSGQNTTLAGTKVGFDLNGTNKFATTAVNNDIT